MSEPVIWFRLLITWVLGRNKRPIFLLIMDPIIMRISVPILGKGHLAAGALKRSFSSMYPDMSLKTPRVRKGLSHLEHLKVALQYVS